MESQGGSLTPGNPPIKDDTDDHLLIETNQSFISHLLCCLLAKENH